MKLLQKMVGRGRRTRREPVAQRQARLPLPDVASNGRALPVLFALLCLTCVATAQAGEIVAARFRITPERPYVGQPFEIRLEIEVTPGSEIQANTMNLVGVPLDAYASLTGYHLEDRRQTSHGDRTVDLLPFVASGRATKPIHQTFNGTLQASLMERQSMGIFSRTFIASAAVRLEPLSVEFRPLPTANIPPGFQGAIGTFMLAGKVDPPQAAPRDIVNLEYTVAGKGWLGNAQVILPPADPNFQVYPAQETRRDENGQLALRQVVIPLNTNATRIGMARLPYFDPAAGVYREATAGPLKLLLTASQTTGSFPAVIHLDVQPNPATASETGAAAVTVTMSHARHLLPFAAVFLLATIVAGLLYGWRPRLAIAAGVVLFIAGAYLCQRWSGQQNLRGREVRELVDARLCPSGNARVLFHIAPGRQVTPLELSEDWVRVDANGQRGWIPRRVLKP